MRRTDYREEGEEEEEDHTAKSKLWRDRAAGWIRNGEKWKTGTERQYLQTI